MCACTGVCLRAGVRTGLELKRTEAAAQGRIEGGSPRCQEVVEGHGDQQHSNHSDESNHSPGILIKVSKKPVKSSLVSL